MSRLNTTIDDNSPLITYSPQDQWHPGLEANDNFASSYSNDGTFTLTKTIYATATFEFNGTGVWLYGAKRPNHGLYSVTLDGVNMGNMSGSSSDGLRSLDAAGNEFQALLFGASNLTETDTHVVVIRNEGTSGTQFLDLDFISWETSSGQDDLTLSPTFSKADLSSDTLTVNGTGWGNVSDDSSLSSPSGIYTRNAGDSVEFSFEVSHFCCSLIALYLTASRLPLLHQGVAVQIFGSIGVACGDFSIEIDGGASKTYNASRYQNLASQLLFSGDNLSSGQHTLKLTNGQTNTGALVLDHSVSYATMNIKSNSSTAQAPPTPSSSAPTRSSSNNALIGGICGALGAVVIVLVILYLWLKRRRRTVATQEKTASKLEAFDIDNEYPRVSHVYINSSIHSGSLRGSPQTRNSHSDALWDSRYTSPSKKTKAHSHNILFDGPISAESSKSKHHVYSPMYSHDDHGLKSASSSSRLPFESPSRSTPANSFGVADRASKHSGRKRSNRRMSILTDEERLQKILRAVRPLPNPHATSSKNRSASSSRNLPNLPLSSYKSQATQKTRRPSIHNSRVLRRGYNIFFARPGSSSSGSAYAPSTAFTSEISERPATTLSPVTEAPPPLPSIRSPIQTPQRTLQITNQADDF